MDWNAVMKLSSYHRERYSQWAGNPRGRAADPERCAETVRSNERGALPSQCQRKRGYGPEGAFCKQHDPEAKKARARKSSLKYELDSWRRFGRAHGKSKVATVAIDLIYQRATHEDLERAVSEYERKVAEMDAKRAELEGITP